MERSTTVSVGVRAIDVGYFNVKYTKGRKAAGDSSTIDVGIYPSLAPQALASDLNLANGPGRADACTVNVRGVNYVVGPGAIYYTSGTEPRPVDPEYCQTDKYYALMLGAMHYMAKDAGARQDFAIDTLVLGLPLNTFHRHAARLEERMRGEHFIGTSDSKGLRRITIGTSIVRVQPFGGLVNFGMTRRAQLDGWTLVLDPGGGTLDWFMSHGQVPNWRRSGAYHKAMLQCAYAVADRINPSWKTQFEVVQAIDDALRTNAASFTVGARQFELSAYRSAIDAVLHESVQAMLDCTGPLDAVKRVLLTGGGATVFHEYLARTIPTLAPLMEIDTDPIFSNVRGFQILGEVLHRGSAR
ncbi:ParM/StbA family protein [Ramlibacter sp. AN1133]|uniref:ParM/StbA family protein n=1 Tax=Ramlibacter sp. AN1133 TaxID=3133429 RepID=UPI0030BCC242